MFGTVSTQVTAVRLVLLLLKKKVILVKPSLSHVLLTGATKRFCLSSFSVYLYGRFTSDDNIVVGTFSVNVPT